MKRVAHAGNYLHMFEFEAAHPCCVNHYANLEVENTMHHHLMYPDRLEHRNQRSITTNDIVFIVSSPPTSTVAKIDGLLRWMMDDG